MRLKLTSQMTRIVARVTAVALVVNLVPLPLQASEASPATQAPAARPAVENVQVVFSGGVVTITYDLVGSQGGAPAEVVLEVSTNGGKTYDVQPKAVSGDHGPVASAGPGKRIVWEAAKDVETLQPDQFRFRVTVRTGNPPAAAAPPVPPASPAQSGPVVQRPAAPVPKPPVPAQPRRGNRFLWPAIGMMAGGGTIAVLAAAGPLRSEYEDTYFDFFLGRRVVYNYYYETNTPILATGLGLAGGGAVLWLLGRRGPSSTVTIAPLRGGVLVSHTQRF